MRIRRLPWLTFALCGLPCTLPAATSVTQYGITWKFDKDYLTGQFCTGDYWVVGPIKVVEITTDLHTQGFTPRPGEDGSMVNPGTDSKQGYDNRLASYRAELNAGLPGGQPFSPQNPLALGVNSSLVSMVSWLFHDPKDTEPGSPGYDAGAKATRSATRSGAVLTVLPTAPPAGSFRPPYSGTDKAVRFNVKQLDLSKLQNLVPAAGAPSPKTLAAQMQCPWIDHVNEWLGAFVHPTENMPNYGRDLARIIGTASLVANLDFSKLPDSMDKRGFVVPLVQMGIDFTGIADNGGGWPANGGHHMGRKWPILMAGILCNDTHMKDVGKWKTRFQEDEQTFYVSQAEVDLTNGPGWKPDRRTEALPYTKEDIGMPEWGIGHAMGPSSDNRSYHAVYRQINDGINPAFILAARLMGAQEAWNHPALFDYIDRMMKESHGTSEAATNSAPKFVVAMWDQYNAPFAKPSAKKP